MTIAGDSHARFSEVEQIEMTDYRPVNRLALAAFLFGLLSSLALIHPVFCVIPLVAVILSIVTGRQLRSSDTQQSGASLALLGLGLSIFFGSWSLARESSRNVHLYAQARICADEWFETLRQEKIYEAHQLTVSEEQRVAEGSSLVEHYSDTSKDAKETKANHDRYGMGEAMEMMSRPKSELDSFFGHPKTKLLRELGSKAHYEFQENVQVVSAGQFSIEVQLKYQVTDESNAQRKQFPISIMLVRTLKPGLGADWLVSRVVE